MAFKKNLFITIAVAAVFYLAASAWMGWERILTALSRFHWWILPFCLLLSLANYIVRFTKWHYYLSLLNISLDRRISLRIFLSGLVMSATPGKFGEVFKSYLLKNVNGVPMSRSAPVVLAERFTDFTALFVMSLLGVTLLPNGFTVFAVSLGIIVLILVLAMWKSAAEKIIACLQGMPMVGKHTDKIRAAYESIYRLIAPGPLAWATIISIASWFCECIAFYLVLWGFGSPLPMLPATFIYAFATILGALLMTPGGIGPTEGAIGGLLILLYSVPEGIAASATLLIRVCTLWFAVAVGLLALALSAEVFNRSPEDLEVRE